VSPLVTTIPRWAIWSRSGPVRARRGAGAGPRRLPIHRAFTLVEVLVVVAILGIVGSAVVPQVLSSDGLVAQAATRSIVADITYAQNEAIAERSNIKVRFEPAENRYVLLEADDEVLITRTQGGERKVDFDENSRFRGVELTEAELGDDQTLIFDDLGSPDSEGTIRLRFNDKLYRIDIAPFTGRVTVQREKQASS